VFQRIDVSFIGTVAYLFVALGPPVEYTIIGHIITVAMFGVDASIYFITILAVFAIC